LQRATVPKGANAGEVTIELAKGNKAIKQERAYMKATFSLDVAVLERLRAVSFITREPMSQIVERLVRDYVKQSRFRSAPRRPSKVD
jgi:hypothetical protein